MYNAELPFMHIDDCECCMQHNKFKQRIINEKVDTPTTTVYRCMKHVLDFTAQCLLSSSSSLLLIVFHECVWPLSDHTEWMYNCTIYLQNYIQNTVAPTRCLFSSAHRRFEM